MNNDTVDKNCDDCDGSGWTEDGWSRANETQSHDLVDWEFRGDCKRCNGTGRIDI